MSASVQQQQRTCRQRPAHARGSCVLRAACSGARAAGYILLVPARFHSVDVPACGAACGHRIWASARAARVSAAAAHDAVLPAGSARARRAQAGTSRTTLNSDRPTEACAACTSAPARRATHRAWCAKPPNCDAAGLALTCGVRGAQRISTCEHANKSAQHRLAAARVRSRRPGRARRAPQLRPCARVRRACGVTPAPGRCWKA
jgi:hypothetical protein